MRCQIFEWIVCHKGTRVKLEILDFSRDNLLYLCLLLRCARLRLGMAKNGLPNLLGVTATCSYPCFP